MINKNTLDSLNRLGFGADVDALESYVGRLNSSIILGNPLVSDYEHKRYKELLRELKPDSLELRDVSIDNIETDQYDKMYNLYGIDKYNEINDQEDLIRLKQIIAELNKSISMTAILGASGQQFRVVYVNGWLHKGMAGSLDITRQIKAVMPNFIEEWRVINLIEVRGELFIKDDDFNNKLSEKYGSVEEAVVALLSGNSIDTELEYLSYQCLRLLTNDLLIESIVDELETLESVRLNVPEYAVIKNVNKLNIEASISKLLQYFESVVKNDELLYQTSGIIVTLNDITTWDKYRENYYCHTFIIKLGHWKSEVFKAIIKDIKFEYGNKYLEPYAIIDKVLTQMGYIDNIPLGSIGDIENNEYFISKELSFIITNNQIKLI